MDEFTIVPSSEQDFVELARTKSGRLFRKHILNKGELIHPKTGAKINVDDTFIQKLQTNFNNKVCDIVQVPLAGPNNEHTEDPDRNLGETIGIEVEGDKVYAVLDIRDEKHAEKMGKTYLGASAMMHLDYTDTRTGKKVGPTLLHTCVTNRPYVLDLEDYQELVAASAEDSGEAVVLTPSATSEEIEVMDLDTLSTMLLEEHGIDLADLQNRANSGEQAAQLSNILGEALTASGVLQLSNGEEVSPDDIVGAVAELANTNVQLSNRLETIEHKAIRDEVHRLVERGFITPANEEAMVELRLSNEELFTKLLPEEPLVKFSVDGEGEEIGLIPSDPGQHGLDVDAEVARYTNQAAEQGYVKA